MAERMAKMSIEEKVAIIKSLQDNGLYHNGSFIKIKYQTPKQTLKSYEKVNGKQEVIKITESVVRLGIIYANTQKFIDQQRDLQPLASQYDRHLKGYERLLIETNRPNEETKYKLICFTTEHKPMVKWLLNGNEVSKDSLKGIISGTEWNVGERPNVYQVKVENILDIEY